MDLNNTDKHQQDPSVNKIEEGGPLKHYFKNKWQTEINSKKQQKKSFLCKTRRFIAEKPYKDQVMEHSFDA